MNTRFDRAFSSPILLLLALALGLFYGLGAVPLFDLDEGAYAEVAREMLARGDFVSTYLNGVPFYDKPVLTYWLQAASVSLFGLNEFAYRLPSALAATAWAWAVFAFARPRLGASAAVTASVMVVTALMAQLIGRAAIMDALLNLFITLAFFDIYRFYESGAAAPRLRAFLWLGLGVLTKGPVALAIPLAASLAFFLMRGAWRQWLRAAFHPLGWLIFLAVSLPWYVAAYLEHGREFLEAFFLRQNVGRFTSNMQGHGGSVFYYFLVLPLVLLPYTGWFVRLLPRARATRTEPLALMLWLWFGVVFLLFSFSRTQLPHYIVYGATPLFLLMAMHAESLRSRWLAFAAPLLVQAVFVLLPEIVHYVAENLRDPYSRQMLARGGEVFGLAYRLPAVIVLVLTLGVVFLRGLSPARGLLLVGLAQAWFVAQSLLPAVGALQQQPVREAALAARELEASTVVMWGFNMPSFSVYRDAVTPQRAPQEGEVVFTHAGRVDRLGQIEVIYQKGGIVLARVIAR